MSDNDLDRSELNGLHGRYNTTKPKTVHSNILVIEILIIIFLSYIYILQHHQLFVHNMRQTNVTLSFSNKQETYLFIVVGSSLTHEYAQTLLVCIKNVKELKGSSPS